MFSTRFLGSLVLIFALVGTSLQLGTWETTGCAGAVVGKVKAPNMACLDAKTGVCKLWETLTYLKVLVVTISIRNP
jgi:hypothetical protein